MLAFRDFVPLLLDPAVLGHPSRYGSVEDAFVRANEWVAEEGVKVFGVETLVLPNIHARHAVGSVQHPFHTSGSLSNDWFQVVRVWFDR